MRKTLPSLLLMALMFFGVSSLAIAQTVVTGDIAGTVTDPTGAAVAAAKLSLKSDATGETYSAVSGSTGEFRFPLLRPGVYTLTVESSGFEQATVKATVSLGRIAAVTVQLGLQKQTEVVNVTEQAALVQTEDANLSTSFSFDQLANLPAPGNDMTAYAFTAPGINVSTGAGYGSFSAFGLPGTSNLFTVNGNDNMDPYLNLNNSGASNLTLGSNELQEAVVVTNGYTGQYGRQAGAQVNYVTKSGSNEFHGNAQWQYNGRVLNANDWFNNASETSRPFAISNEWAASAGGPIRKNKLFFYADNEGLRYVLPSGGPVYIPTPEFATATLNHLSQVNPAAVPFYTTAFNLYAGASGASRAVPVTSALDETLGCGDIVDSAFGVTKPCARTFQSTVNNLNTEWILAGRVDYNATSNDRLNFRYNMDRGVQATGTDPINPAFNANSVQPSYGGQMAYTRVIGSKMVNNLLLSASYYSALFGPPDLAGALKLFPTTWAFNDGLYSNMGGTDNSYPSGRKVRQHQLIDDFSITHGAHNLKFGVNVRRNWVSTYTFGANTSGSLTFNSMTDLFEGSLTNGSTYGQRFSRVGAQPLSMYSAGFYAQDEWKVRSNLNLTLAARFDRNSNIRCLGNCFNEFDGPFSQINHSASVAYKDTIKTGLSNAFPSNEAMVFSPRAGVAYNVAKSTVIRGGFGLFTDLYPGTIADRFITNSPAVATFTTTSGLIALNNPNSIFAAVANSNSALQNGFANGATLAQLQASVPLGFATPDFNTLGSKILNPKYYEWNFEVQESLGSNYMLSVNYVGNHGWNQFNQTVLGNAYTKSGYTLPGVGTAKVDTRFGQIRELNNAGWSNYNGLVSSFKWRATSDFSGQISYTWSHALDTCSNGCLLPYNYTALGANSIRNQLSATDVRLNYGSADYDSRHALSANYVYTVPARYFQNSILRGALAGWTISGTVIHHTGTPFSVVNSGVRSTQLNGATGLASAAILADWIGGGSAYPACTVPNVTCYTASQFRDSKSQRGWGNIPRNSFRGPKYFNTDLNIKKAFSVHERYKLDIGAAFFNVLNHPNFDTPYNNVASGLFGTILETVSAPTSAYGSFQGSAVSGRVIQTAIKFTF